MASTILVPLFCSGLLLSAQEPTIPPAEAEVYALLDELGFADAPDAQFVVVFVGPRERAQPLESAPIYGELLEAGRDRFTVALLEVGRTTYAIGPDVPERLRAVVEPVDLSTLAREMVADLRQARERAVSTRWRDAAAPLSPATRALLVARACARRGLHAAAREIQEALPRHYRSKRDLVADWSFLHDVRNRLLFDHADPGLSWPDLLARHDGVLAVLTANGVRRGDRLSFLRIRNDAAEAAARTGVPASGAEGEARRLVETLCDQFTPASLFTDSEPMAPRAPLASYGPQPADRLIAMGLPAVPALIEALRDERPTRSVSFCGRFGRNSRVCTVGETAGYCLAQIAGGYAVAIQHDEAATWRAWYERASRAGIGAALREGAWMLLPSPAIMRMHYGW